MAKLQNIEALLKDRATRSARDARWENVTAQDEYFVWKLFQQLRRRDFALGPQEYDLLRVALQYRLRLVFARGAARGVHGAVG